MKQQHPEIARDPSSLLIAVTSADLYIPDLGSEICGKLAQGQPLCHHFVRAIAAFVAGAVES